MRYVSTRGQAEPLGFGAAVAAGLASDGGLFVPASLPDLSGRLAAWRGLGYEDLAFEFLRLFADDIPADAIPTDAIPTDAIPTETLPPGTDPSQWAALRDCESGGDYSITNPSGKYRGAYQFDRSTWDSVASRHASALVGIDPAAASPAEQDAMAMALYSERGAGPWPHCGRHLG